MSDGWIKLHRKLLDWEWFTDTPVLALFIYLVVSANHKPKKFRGHEIERGQTVIGLHSAAERTGLSPQKVRTALKKLKSTGEITSKSTNKFTIITICNYEKYQIQESAEQQALQQTNNKPLTTNKKERKKEIKKKRLSVETYVPTAQMLIDIVEEKKPGKNLGNRTARQWANSIRLLVERDKESHEHVQNVLRWYSQNWDDTYTPVVESGKSLRDKFSSLENAMQRNTGTVHREPPSRIK
jgi:hypothetical protein